MGLSGNGWEYGFCLDTKGDRPEEYKTLLHATMEECEKFCKYAKDATGCEYSVHFVACKAHTKRLSWRTKGGHNGFFCLQFKKKGQ